MRWVLHMADIPPVFRCIRFLISECPVCVGFGFGFAYGGYPDRFLFLTIFDFASEDSIGFCVREIVIRLRFTILLLMDVDSHRT